MIAGKGGRILVRCTPELHRQLVMAAKAAHISLNQYIVTHLAYALGRYEATR